MTRRAHAAALTALLATAGCATAPRQAEWVEMRPLEVGVQRPVSASDGYYSGAVSAIDRRDYAAALELLQLARARAPSDVRVFNAFAVVYDKLGRFDLSARYYAQAAALEPSSPIVAANVAYSAVLERRIGAPVEGVRLASVGADLKTMARPDLTVEAPPPPRRIVEAAQPLSVAAIAAPARIDAVRAPRPSAALRRMTSPDLSEPSIAPAPTPVALTLTALAPAVASPVPTSASIRAEAPPASPAPRLKAAVAAPVAAVPPQAPSPPRHVLHPVVAPATTSLVAAAARVDVAGRPVAAYPRAMAQPVFVAAAEQPPSASAPVRLAMASAPPQALPQLDGRLPVVRLQAGGQASPPVVKLASTTVAPRRLRMLTGNTLLVLNASGRRFGGDPVVTRLAHLGWSLPRSAKAAPAQRRTSIVYPARDAAVARALARTLPYKVQLVSCASRCDRMRLVLGADALGWRKGPRVGSMVRVKIA